MPTLRLSLSGLCTFVFDPPLDPLEESAAVPRRLTVLLQRLTRARPLSNRVNLQPEVLDQHFPLLDFDLRDLQESTRKPDFHCLPDGAGRMTRGVCLLNGEDLSILVDGVKTEGRPLSFSRAEPASLDHPSPLEQESLFWMAALDDTRPGAVLDRRLLDTAPGSNQPILARLQVDGGRLKTRELTDLPCTVAGAVGAPKLNRRVATAFELEVGFEKTVRIEMVANRNGRTTKRSLVLAPAGGGDLEIGLANMEIDRYVGMDPASGPRVEADSEVYSDLLANPPGRGEPRPFLRQAGPGMSSGQGMSGCAPIWGRPAPAGG